MKIKRWVFLLTVLLLLSLAGCKTVPANAGSDDIVGIWKDSYGLTEYKFEPGGTVKIKALNLGSFKGSYQIDDDQITIEYSIIIKDVKDTYRFRMAGNSMYLNDNRFTRKE